METLLPMICGTETEFSILFLSPDYKIGGQTAVISGDYLPNKLLSTLPKGLYSFREFTSNGGRYYVDVGSHVEWATPECDSLEDVVAYEMAGEEIVLHGLNKLKKVGDIGGYRVNKRVVDNYGHAWGAHENYQIPREFKPDDKFGKLQPALAAHLATRNVLVGAGRVTNHGQYTVAQKAFTLDRLATLGTTDSRALINTRDEQLDLDKFRRLHLIGGDANVLPWALAMKLGTTAVLLRMVQEGVPLDDLRVNRANVAGIMVAADPNLQKTITLANGKNMKPVEIQAELSARAKTLSSRRQLPEQEIMVIDEWQWACDMLQFDRNKLYGLADWVTKLALIDRYKERHPQSGIKDWQKKDLQYDSLGEQPGMGVKLRPKSGFDMDKVNRAITEPPANTRAYLRGNIIRQNATTPKIKRKLDNIDWRHITFNSGVAIKLTARQKSYRRLEEMFDPK